MASMRRRSNWTKPRARPSTWCCESEDLRNALEMEVNTVVTQAVRKICKAHGATLTAAQAQNVAMVLFGD